jgi:hypothetical protein
MALVRWNHGAGAAPGLRPQPTLHLRNVVWGRTVDVPPLEGVHEIQRAAYRLGVAALFVALDSKRCTLLVQRGVYDYRGKQICQRR